MQLENRVAVTVEADIDEVWDVVRDVTRVGEWSHECVGAEWLAGADAPVPGARFRGRNRAGVFRWGRVCEIVSADPYELVWITVPTALYPDSSEWRITLAEVDAGTRITQQFRVLACAEGARGALRPRDPRAPRPHRRPRRGSDPPRRRRHPIPHPLRRA